MEKNSQAETLYEKLSEGVTLRNEYLELASKGYATCLDELTMINVLMNKTALGATATVFAFFLPLFFLKGYALAVVLVIQFDQSCLTDNLA